MDEGGADALTPLKIERLGGSGGFGGPGSRVRSEGRLDMAALDHDTHRAVENLFPGRSDASAPPQSPHADGFTYRIPPATEAGEEAVEVPESAVPAALTQAVRDELI